MQIVLDPERSAAAHAAGAGVRLEYVIAVRGTIVPRSPETVNPDLPTGGIEIVGSELRVLNTARPSPFPVDDAIDTAEAVRLRYRYLDLRRPRMFKNLWLRHRLAARTREYLNGNGFVEVETPMLTRSTPEGARDYLVPSRVNPGAFFALPAVAAALQADPHGGRRRPLLPDRALLPRRGPARRPPARVHADRPRDVLPRAARRSSA